MAARRAFALATALYFIVVVGLLATAVVGATRRVAPTLDRMQTDAQLVAAAEGAVYEELAEWDAGARAQQRVGSTIEHTVAARAPLRPVMLSVTRLTPRVYALIASAQVASGTARRVNLLVRVPFPAAMPRGALVSAGDVLLGQDVRVIIDSANCGWAQPAVLLLAPGARALVVDALAVSEPVATVESDVAADTLTYARVAGVWWDDLVARADVRLEANAHVAPSPRIADGACVDDNTNWGEPRRATPRTACERRTVLVHVAGDLTIDGGSGQGTLLVEGRLRIAGPFLFSGQIVARGGIESLSDGIALTGLVMSAARNDARDASHSGAAPVSLRYSMTLRASGCDAQHGVASWLEPRVVRERAWAEVF